MTQNIDQHEVNKFAEIAENWWDPTGDFKPLHVINPLRANYINQKISVEGLKVLDVGCGGGLLAEALDAKGANVTAIDVTEANIGVAQLHAEKMQLEIDYRLITAEELAEHLEVSKSTIYNKYSKEMLFIDGLNNYVINCSDPVLTKIKESTKGTAITIPKNNSGA